MIIVRSPDDQAKRRAIGFLAGRYSFKSWASGEMMVPAAALATLAVEGIQFHVQGPASFEQLATPLRNPIAASV